MNELNLTKWCTECVGLGTDDTRANGTCRVCNGSSYELTSDGKQVRTLLLNLLNDREFISAVQKLRKVTGAFESEPFG